MWRPLVTISSIMVIAAGAARLGLLEAVAGTLFARAQASTLRLFTATFLLSALTASVLNNDAAILLLTPVVVALIRRQYPENPEMLYPFVFAIFMSAGVAPMVISNPMNLIFAQFAGIGFNSYLVLMAPIAVAGWLVSLLLLGIYFSRVLRSAAPANLPQPPRRQWNALRIGALALIGGIFAAYPVVSYLGGPIWAVAACGAVATLAVCMAASVGSPGEIARRDVSWDILAFLGLLAVFAIGIERAGLADWLAGVYRQGGEATIGVVSAVGSALINNHPMSLVNIAALDPAGNSRIEPVLAALIGGDLGPRLLPAGSLAGLLWFATLRNLGVKVQLGMFCRVGALLTIPSLGVSLLLLSVLS